MTNPTPRDLIARSLHALYGHVHADAEEWDNLWKLRPDAYRREADEVLTALDQAGYTIVKRNTALTAAGDNPHDAPLARAALRVQAVALAAFQQTPATPNPGSIPAGEADTPSGGDINTQQQEDQ